LTRRSARRARSGAARSTRARTRAARSTNLRLLSRIVARAFESDAALDAAARARVLERARRRTRRRRRDRATATRRRGAMATNETVKVVRKVLRAREQKATRASDAVDAGDARARATATNDELDATATVAAREEAYRLARERIFGDGDEGEGDDVADETTTTTTTTKESIAAKLATELRRLADRISYEVDKRECGYGFFDLKRPSDDVNVLLDALNAVEGRYKDIGRDA